MLENAGIDFAVHPANIDETEIHNAALRKPTQPGDLALTLARSKAEAVSSRYPDHWTIGADQVLWCGGSILNKPVNLVAAREQLKFLRGRSHELSSAVAVAFAGKTHWHMVDRALMVMRHFSDDFLDDYLSDDQEDLLTSVGAYRLEGRGVQLFDRIEGDYFTILGLPLLPLLAFLRNERRLQS